MITFLIKRAKKRWRVLSTVLLGVVFSTAFLASGPIIVDAVINFALPYRLRSSIDENGIIYLSTHNNQGSISRQDLDLQVREIIDSNLYGFKDIIHATTSPWVYPWQDGYLINDERISFITISDIEERINFISGDWPKNQALEPNTLQAAISMPMATAYAINIGEQLPISLKFDESLPSYAIEISGIYEPLTASDPFWLIRSNPFQISDNQRYSAEYEVLLQEKDYLALEKELFQNSNHRLSWLGIINPSKVNSENTQEFIQGIEAVRESLSKFDRKVSFKTNLDIFLENFEESSSEIIPPIYLLISEVVILGLYYVLMVAGLSTRQVEGEMAVLASRGAKYRQLLGIQFFDAILICTTAFIIGPIFSQVIINSLANYGPLSDISQADWVTRIPRASWLAAGVSVLACLTALFIPMLSILRSSVVHHQHKITRRNDKPWWHRYYLDILLFVIGLGAIWRLSLYGSISRFTQGNLDWLLLLAPLALLVGSALILLRFFPVVFQALASLSAQGRGLTTALALWQTARDPTQAAGLILLFTLAMALGILSTGMNATLEQSESDRARYSTGGEARFSFDTFIPPSMLDSMPQVVTSSAVWRGRGRTNVRSYRNIPEFSIMAIDPLSFAKVSQFRSDYTDDYIGYVLGQLIVDPAQLPVSAIPLPGKPTHLGIWIADPNPTRTEDDLLEFISLRAKIISSEAQTDIIDLALTPRLYDPDHDQNYVLNENNSSSRSFHYFSYIPKEFGADLDYETALISDAPVWRFYEASLPDYHEQGYPLALHSLWIKIRQLPEGSSLYPTSLGPLILDDLSTKNSNQALQVIEGFEELKTIWQTDSNQSISSYTKNEITHSGQASLRLFLGSSNSSSWTVISPAQTKHLNSIPILAGPSFLEMTELKVGDQFAAFINGISLILEIKNSVNYFPTMYETDNFGYVVISRDALLGELNRASRVPINFNEILFRVDESQDIQGVLNSFSQATRIWEVGSEKLLYKSDPLTLGLRSVIYLGYALTLLLSLVGFATHLYMGSRKRAAVYGILRALGLSTPQLYASLVFEQLIIIFSGLGLGILSGTILNRMILPGLPISFGDMPAIPPFIPQSDWSSVIRIILIFLGGFLLTLAVGTFLLWRLKLHQVLRVGEE